MIDMHSHILPSVDDGAEYFEEAREMVEIAVHNGTTDLVLTPHYILGHHGARFSAEELRERFETFSQKIKRLFPELTLYFGAENFITDYVLRHDPQKKLIPIGDTNYVLIEFDFNEWYHIMENAVEVLLSCGLRPIIAHPERYDCFYKKPEMLRILARKGCLFQMNADSPLGLYGHQAEEVSYWMLCNQLVHCIGSDAHKPYQRTPDMGDIYAFISLHFSKRYKRQLFEENPRLILGNAAIEIEDEEEEL